MLAFPVGYPAAGEGPAPRGGGAAGRGQPGVLRAIGAWPGHRVSPGVVDAVATALRLDEDERVHLDRLIAALTPEARKRSRSRRRTRSPRVCGSCSTRWGICPRWCSTAVSTSSRSTIWAARSTRRTTICPGEATAPVSCSSTSRGPVAVPRVGPDRGRHGGDPADRGRCHPEDPELIKLIGQLSTRSAAFRIHWAGGDVRAHRGGTKMFRHPLIGEVTLPFENLHIDAVSGQVLTVFTPSRHPRIRRHPPTRQLER